MLHVVLLSILLLFFALFLFLLLLLSLAYSHRCYHVVLLYCFVRVVVLVLVVAIVVDGVPSSTSSVSSSVVRRHPLATVIPLAYHGGVLLFRVVFALFRVVVVGLVLVHVVVVFVSSDICGVQPFVHYS